MRKVVQVILLIAYAFNFSLSAQYKRIALVIGNAKYEFAPALANPTNDSKALSDSLKNLGFTVVKQENLNHKDMRKAIDSFSEMLQHYDVGLFFYAGHGIQVNGINYLVPVDANLKSETDVEYDCVNVGRLLSNMEVSQNKTNVIILDACRNNPFERSWSRSLKNKGLAFMEAPTGSLIAYATSPGSVASDGSDGNGLYTECLLNNIGNPDLNILQVFQEVRKQVKTKSGGSQIPWESTSLENDFYFNQTGINQEYSIKGSSNEKTIAGKTDLLEEIEQIKENKNVIWAESYGITLNDADISAKDSLSRKLFDFLRKKNKEIKSEVFSSVLEDECYELFLKDLEFSISRKVYVANGLCYVIKYIPEIEIKNIREIKKQRILNYYQNGIEAENKLMIGDALKNYYWSYSLAIAYQERGIIVIPDENKDVIDVLEKKIEYLLNSVEFVLFDSVSIEDNTTCKIEFTFKGKPIQNLSFRYLDGTEWSDINVINNGIGIIEFTSDVSLGNIKVKIEYKYDNQAKFDKNLNQLIKLTHSNKFDSYTEKCNSKFSKEINISTNADKIIIGYNEIVNKVIEKANNKDKTFDASLFTENGFEVYKSLLLYGNALIRKSTTLQPVSKLQGNFYVRGIPCKFRFKNNSVKFNEKLCFKIDSSGRVDNISFTLSDKATQDIVNQPKWPECDKWQIINFLENYRTAYALERLDYIEKIFSDDALIIIGQKVEVSNQLDQPTLKLKEDKYKYTKLSKEEYIYRLRKVFQRNEFVNIQFEDNVVKKRDLQSEVYGINIKQNYYSSNYADEGYLFLMVDVKDEVRPIIYVRSWQPDKNFDGKVIGLSDFTY